MKGKSVCSIASCRLAALVLAAMLFLTACSGGGGGPVSSSKLLQFIKTYQNGYHMTGEVTSGGSTAKIDMISTSSAEYLKYTIGSVSEVTLKDGNYTYTLNERAKTYTQKAGSTRSGYGLPDKSLIKSITVDQWYTVYGVTYEAEKATIRTGTSSTRDIFYCFDSAGTLRYMVTYVNGSTVVVKYNSFSTTYDATKLTLDGYRLEGDEPDETVTVSISITPSGSGTVSGSGTYIKGDEVTVKATPKTGYHFVNWKKNGAIVSSNASYTFTASESVTLVAVFEKNPAATVDIGISITPSGSGTVSGSGTYTVGDSVTVKATPKTGYHFVNWKKNGVVVSSNASYTFTASESVTLIAVFEKNPDPTINVSLSVTPSGSGTVSGAGSYTVGASVTVKATPNTGYRFVGWNKNGFIVSSDTSYTFVASESVTLTAVFEESTVTINTAVTPSGSGTVTGAGTYTVGYRVTLTATPNTGYSFVGWKKNGFTVSTNASYTFTASESVTLTAVFEENEEDSDINAIRQEILRLVNIERAKEGIAPLTMDNSNLTAAAQLRATELPTLYSHTRPDGTSCFTALSEFGVTYRYAGENIAAGYPSAAAVVNGWMNSEGHRANIMNPNYKKLGVGYCYSSGTTYGHYWVQMFIG